VPAEAITILSIITWCGVPVGVYAFIHALLQRPDAYTAIDRFTKPAWLGITAGGAAGLLLVAATGGIGTFFGWTIWIAGLVATLVYIVDVRPRLIEVQRGNRW
jgi:uncharacterized protein DUF2516